jgi:MYXO-CTERM domain-containing protein
MAAGKNLVGALAAFTVVGVVSFAGADTNVIPGVQINVTIDGQLYEYDPSAQMAWGNPNGTFGFYGNAQANGVDGGHSIGWDMLVNPDPFIIANLIYTNVSALTQAVVVEVVLPIGMPMGSSLIGGSVSGSLTDVNGNGATFTALGGGAYSALADGSVAASLLSGVTVNAGPFGSALIGPDSFGTPIPSQPYGAINSTMAIRYEFSLTAGDSVALAGSFVAVPGPGAVALLGLAGLVARRRRR